MEVFVFTFLFFTLMIGAMSVGVLMGRKPIKGSCGGMSALGIDTSCDVCGGDPNKCENEQTSSEKKAGDLAYDASK
jgi:hypothetical protein